MASKRLRKALTKLALTLPFFALAAVASQSCGPSEPPKPTCHFTITCENCEVVEVHDDGTTTTPTDKIDVIRDYDDNVKYRFAGIVPDVGTGFFLPKELEVTIDGEKATRDQYTYSPTTGNFSMILSAPTVDIKATADSGKCVVSFINTGDQPIEPYEVIRGNRALPPDVPTKAGQVFGGWFLGEGTATRMFSFSQPINENITLAGRWYDNDGKITINFDSGDGGSFVAPQRVRPGESLEDKEPTPPPTKEGHTFQYWSLEPPTQPQTKFEFDKHIAGNTSFTLYAYWKIKNYDVTFHRTHPVCPGMDEVPQWYYAGTDPTAETRDVGADHGRNLLELIKVSASTITLKTSEHYDFVHWSYSETADKPIGKDDTVTKNMDLYPVFAPHVFHITLDGNGGGWPDGPVGHKTILEYDLPYGSTLDLPRPEHRPDVMTRYEFAGWQPTVTDEKIVVTDDATYVAQWTAIPITYTVTVHANGGEFVKQGASQDSLTFPFTPGQAWGDINAQIKQAYPGGPEREGYQFLGWGWASGPKTPIIYDEDILTEDVRDIYARWNIKTYEVDFWNEKEPLIAYDIQYVEHGDCLEVPVRPEATGYTFQYWYKEDPSDDYDFKTPVTQSFNLYTYWTINTYKLTFDANGGTITGTTQCDVEYNKSLSTYVNAVKATKEGYKFTKWKYDEPAEHYYTDGEKMPAHDVKLIAQYEIDSFKMNFDANGGTGGTMKWVKYNTAWSEIEKAAPTPTRDHFDFKGWSLSKDNPKPISKDWKMPAKEVTVYAIWELTVYPVTLDGHGGKWGDKTTITRSTTFGKKWGDDILNGENPTLEGYKFDRYTSDQDGKNEIKAEDAFNPTILRIFAQYEILKFHVKFDANGGKGGPATQEVEWGKLATEPPKDKNPTLAEHTFVGWYKEQGGINKFDFAKTPIKADITLYAKYEINKRTVTFDANGGTFTPTTATSVFKNIPVGTPIKNLINHPTGAKKDHYNFVDWIIDDKHYTPEKLETFTVPDVDIKIIANYAIVQNKVKFEVDGEVISEVKVDYGGKVTRPADPSKYGYNFDGWYKDNKYTESFNFNVETITKDTTLYGRFIPKKYAIILYANSGTFPGGATTRQVSNVDFGSEILGAIKGIEDPSKEGYDFSCYRYGESTESEKVEKGDKLDKEENLQIYASYTIKHFTVKFDANGGKGGPESQSVEWGGHATKPADKDNTTKEGYDFVNWYVEPACVHVFEFGTTKITSDTTVYAGWQKHTYTINFVNYDGEVVHTEHTLYQDMPLVPTTPPTRPADEMYTYKFAGWTPKIAPATEDTNYYATYDATPIDYQITWKYHPAGAEEVTSVWDKHYDDILTPPATVSEYTVGTDVYKFVGWSPEITPVSRNATYTAQYTKQEIHHTVTWKNYDGTVLETDQVLHGQNPSYDGETPVKKSETGHSFEFIGWDKPLAPITADTTYVAQFTNSVSVTFHGEGCTSYGSSDWTTSIIYEGSIAFTIVADYEHVLPGSILVTVDGKVINTSYVYNPNTGAFNMTSIQGHVVITVIGGEL